MSTAVTASTASTRAPAVVTGRRAVGMYDTYVVHKKTSKLQAENTEHQRF